MQYTSRWDSPLGEILLACDGDALTGLWFDGQKYFGYTLTPDREEAERPVLREAKRWLDLYFAGRDPGFTPPLRFSATPLREAVWRALLAIPYGRTMTSGEVARAIAGQNVGLRPSARAVGGAVGHNPISLIVPCHRVVGADGSLTGYAGGLARKQALLQREGADPARCQERPAAPSR